MQSVNPNKKITNNRSPPPPAMNEKKKVPLFKPEDDDLDVPPSDYSRNRKLQQGRNRGHPGDSDRDETDSVDEYNNNYGRGGRGGGVGNPKALAMKKNSIPRHEPEERYPPHDSPGGGGDKYVTVEEYDELSKLCDKLLSQQEALQSEIRNQSHIIKVYLHTVDYYL